MIVDKRTEPAGIPETFAEAPPSYEEPPASTSALPVLFIPEKAGWSTYTPPSGQQSLSTGDRTTLQSAKARGKAKEGSSSWFNFCAQSRKAAEVKVTVLGLVRDLVKQNVCGDAARGILESCSEVCTAYGLKLSEVLQENSIEQHPPVYWAILKRPAEDTPALDTGTDLVTALLLACTPLLPGTISEVRLACLLNSDQALFQRLRKSPVFAPLRGTDEMMMGDESSTDDVSVFDVPEDDAAFAVDFAIHAFQVRMKVSGSVEVEFIAKGRLWALEIRVPTSTESAGSGSWKISLRILEHSLPTPIDSCLFIPDPTVDITDLPLKSLIPQSAPESFNPSSLPVSGSSTSTPAPSVSQTGSSWGSPFSPRTKPKPTITLRLRSRGDLVPGGRYSSVAEASSSESLMANSLQFANSSYIRPDGILRARLEARLGAPLRSDEDCIIC